MILINLIVIPYMVGMLSMLMAAIWYRLRRSETELLTPTVFLEAIFWPFVTIPWVVHHFWYEKD